MAQSSYDNQLGSITAPGRKLVALTKDDDNDLPEGIPKALWVGTAGTANLVDGVGNACANFPLFQGLNPIRIKRLKLGGTASDIWGLY